MSKMACRAARAGRGKRSSLQDLIGYELDSVQAITLNNCILDLLLSLIQTKQGFHLAVIADFKSLQQSLSPTSQDLSLPVEATGTSESAVQCIYPISGANDHYPAA